MTWYDSEKGQKLLGIIENEKQEVLVGKLASTDRNSPSLSNLILYGLLPCAKTKYAMRISTFPVFMNIKLLFRNYNYEEKD